MEMGSSSFTESGGSSSSPPNSSESLNGLKFGQKIYFEDVGLGALAKSGGGSSSSHAGAGGSGTAAQPRKGRGGVVQGGQPPRCQVEGCRVDLSDAKTYYSRHKVCGMHSKAPKVVVSGLEQRFCQQCSRFHQLSEFDQGKRSCRRRLAGHNERRRKPPPGSLMSSRYGRLSSSIYENSGRVGGLVMDFGAYPRLTGRDAWSTARLPEQAPGNQVTATGKYLPHPWHSNSENPSPDLFLQGCSTVGTGVAGPGIPPGECFTGVSDSSCALSLLSNQPWGSSANRTSGLGMNNLMNPDVVPITMSQLTAPHGAASANHFPNASWGFKGNEAGSSAHGMVPDLGLGQNQFSGELELSQQGRRHYMELEHSRPYDSTQQMHWSL